MSIKSKLAFIAESKQGDVNLDPVEKCMWRKSNEVDRNSTLYEMLKQNVSEQADVWLEECDGRSDNVRICSFPWLFMCLITQNFKQLLQLVLSAVSKDDVIWFAPKVGKPKKN